jgi:L,D-peptidoglycan transpeptidase YkuD (ErfK/YbiS/YcfS/YnhG family)
LWSKSKEFAVKRKRAKLLSRPATIRVLATSAASTQARLALGSMVIACALGRAGSRVGKREGDGATPIGRWRVGEVFYRMDRLRRPRTRLPVRPLRRLDGWCDAVGDRNYNRPVRHPYAASAEKLWRSDSLYDLILTLRHNARPRVQGHGSAIFLHVAGPGYPTTAGCIAVARLHLLRVLGRLDRDSVVYVLAPAGKKRPEEVSGRFRARTGKLRARAKQRVQMERGTRCKTRA